LTTVFDPVIIEEVCKTDGTLALRTIEGIEDIFRLIDESKYQPWATNSSHLFKNSEYKKAILFIKESSKKCIAQETNKLLQYIEIYKDNIDCAKYLSPRAFIGSGAIESSNKTVS
jgi:hypothetical protein